MIKDLTIDMSYINRTFTDYIKARNWYLIVFNDMYKEFNEIFFNNTLPKDLIIGVNFSEKYFGTTYIVHNDTEIKNIVCICMSIVRERSIDRLISNLLHEMIHVQEAVLGYIPDENNIHGEPFKRLYDELNSKHTVTWEETDDLSFAPFMPMSENKWIKNYHINQDEEFINTWDTIYIKSEIK